MKKKPKLKPGLRNNGSGPPRRTHKPLWLAATWLVEEHAIKQRIITDHRTGRDALQKRLGTEANLFKHVIAAAMPIPRDDVVVWADGLRLGGEERRQFLSLVLLSYAAESLVAAWLRLDKPLAKTLRGLVERRRKHEKKKKKKKKKKTGH